MHYIKMIGKGCKSRVMHLTESEAGIFFLSAVALNVLLISLLAFSSQLSYNRRTMSWVDCSSSRSG